MFIEAAVADDGILLRTGFEADAGKGVSPFASAFYAQPASLQSLASSRGRPVRLPGADKREEIKSQKGLGATGSRREALDSAHA